MSHSTIELVVFDMDGVLATLDKAKRLELLASYSGRPSDLIRERIYESDFESSAEAGAYPVGHAYLAEFNRRIDSAVTCAQWVTARRDAMTPIRETFEIARRLKKRVRLATLTNNGSLFKEAIGDILPAALEVFGGSFHASYEFGARKPDPRVFERMAARYNVAANRVLFIDDMPEYLDGARSVGMKAMQFTSPDSLSSDLAALGVLSS